MKTVDIPLVHVLLRKQHRAQCIRSFRVERSRKTKSTIEIYSDDILIGLVDSNEKSATINVSNYSRLTSQHQLATRAWLNRHNYNVATVRGEL